MQICPKCRTRLDNPIERCPHDGRRLVADLTGVTVAGRYLLKELLGIGGMDSSVWLAVQQQMQRPVAIKLLPPADGESADRFARGARIASNLSHPHITVVHDYGRTEEGQLYLVMELLEGRILHDVMRAGALPVDQALHITDQVLKALDHAHKKKVVHRDIKPGNLFLCSRNEDPNFVKVLDFGIARFIDAGDAFFDEPHHEITTTRQICGTPQYMAPEQIAMGTVDARTDLYALGIVLYRMITGDLPFQAKDHRELFRAHLTQTPPPFARIRPGLDLPELEALVMRALAKSPDDRFASAAEMRTALRQLRVRMGGGGPEDEFTPISSVVSRPSVSTLPGTMPHSVIKPKRDLALPLVLVSVVLLGLIAFLLMRPDAATTVPDAAVTVIAVVPDAAAGAPETELAAPTTFAAPVTQAPPPPDAGVPAAPPSVAAVLTGQVYVTSAPNGARIRLEGNEIGTTPKALSLPVGVHRLVLTRGPVLATLTVEVRAGSEIPKFHAVLRRPATDLPAAPPSRPRPEVPPSVAAPSAAPGSTVRMKLLDEGEARDFETGGKPGPAAPASEKPRVDLLDD